MRNAKILHLRHRSLFACGTEISAEARVRMAAAVQSFVSGDTGMTAYVSAQQSVERGAEVTLAAWRGGLKSLTVVFDPAIAAQPVRKAATTTRRIKAAAQPHAKPMASLPRKSRAGKSAPVLAAKKPSSTKRATR